MSDQLNFFEALRAPEPPPVVREGEPMPKDGLVHLRALTAAQEPLIFMIGANPHLRFVRSFSSTDPGWAWHGGQGCSVMYGPAQEILRAAGYHKRGRHTFAEDLGNTGYKNTADVWGR